MSPQLPTITGNQLQTLQKIISIKNIGRFKRTDCSGDVSFSKCTLIFAENGRGKTTLCSILRSLAIGDPRHITGRQTLGSREAPEILIRLSNENIQFQNGQWAKAWPQILVYDNTFVTENIYSGEVVGADHRRNLYQLIIGQQGVQLANQERELTQAISDKQSQIRDTENQIKTYIPQGVSLTVDRFIQLPAQADIETLIQEKERELESVQQAAVIQQRSALSTITLPSVPERLSETLSATLDGLTQQTEQRVKAHINQHHMDQQGEAWLSQGLTYIQTDTCPFCSQSLENVDLISIYQAYFSQDYAQLKTNITQLKQKVERLFGDQAIASLQQTIQQNETHLEFWVRFCPINRENFVSPQTLIEDIRAAREAIIHQLNQKIQAPLEAMPVDATTQQALGTMAQLSQQVISYNQQMASINTLITNKKHATQSANVQTIQAELGTLNASKNRHLRVCETLCQSYQQLLTEKTVLETQKTDVKTRLDEYTNQAIAPYEQTINRFLDQFNAGYKIQGVSHSRSGGAPNTSYQIVINDTLVNIGASDTPLDTPSFKNTLSSGDKSTLALAFFLARLEQDPDRANRIVVFDDPFTSQDSFRRNNTVRQIKNCVQNCAQVIVLSHDMRFLYQVWEKLTPPERKALQLIRVGEINTNITAWDIEDETRTRHEKELFELNDFLAEGVGNPIDIIRKVRSVLETHCKKNYPAHFDSADTLGNICEKVRLAGNVHPLGSIYTTLDELNEYTRPFHHGHNPQASLEDIDGTELSGAVRRTLVCVGLIH